MKYISFLIIISILPALLYFFQDSMIYFPRKYNSSYRLESGIDYIPITYETSQGKQTSFYLPPMEVNSSSPLKIWVLFGGNAALALDWYYFVREYPDKSAGFLLFDYPGYGYSQGKPSPASIFESSNVAIDKLLSTTLKDNSKENVSLNVLGQSLGTGPALEFSNSHPTQHIILLSPFTSLLDMAKRSVGIPLCYLLKHRFDNKATLKKVLEKNKTKSITIIHGTKDEVIPVSMGRRLANEYMDSIKYIEIPSGDHNRLLSIAQNRIFKAMEEDEL
jgi:uncharacterized protein